MAQTDFVSQAAAVLKASRPPGWCFGPILYGIGVIHSKVMPKTLSEILTASIQVFSLSIPLCIVVFGMNDIYDYDSDIVNPRKMGEGHEGGVLAPVHHPAVRASATASTIFILLTSLIPLYPSFNPARPPSLQTQIVTATLVFFGWQYSAPPLRLKEAPVFDSLSNGLIVFLAWFIGFSTLSGKTLVEVPGKGYLVAFVTAGVHALGAATDVDSDAAAGQSTIATYLGPRGACIFGVLTYVVALSIEGPLTIFGVYLCGGLGIMMLTVVQTAYSHRAFQSIVIWTVGMSILWFVAQGWKTINVL